MNIDEYNSELTAIKQVSQQSIIRLKRKYALLKSIANVGDLIEDHIGKIIITTVRVYLSDPPQCIYDGIVCRKDGTPAVKTKTRDILQSNCKFVNGVEVNELQK